MLQNVSVVQLRILTYSLKLANLIPSTTSLVPSRAAPPTRGKGRLVTIAYIPEPQNGAHPMSVENSDVISINALIMLS